MSQLGTLIARYTNWLGGLVSLPLEEEDGQTLAEYALIFTLVVAIVVVVLITISGTIGGMFTSASSAI